MHSPGGASVHSPGGADGGVQKWPFVRVSRGARNPMVAALFCLPATGQNGHNCRTGHVVPVLHVSECRFAGKFFGRSAAHEVVWMASGAPICARECGRQPPVMLSLWLPPGGGPNYPTVSAARYLTISGHGRPTCRADLQKSPSHQGSSQVRQPCHRQCWYDHGDDSVLRWVSQLARG